MMIFDFCMKAFAQMFYGQIQGYTHSLTVTHEIRSRTRLSFPEEVREICVSQYFVMLISSKIKHAMFFPSLYKLQSKLLTMFRLTQPLEKSNLHLDRTAC